MEFKKGLAHFGNQIELHAKLINTFSLMEYIGARKILKSQSENSISETLLTHVAEEVRHAMTLKRLALRMSDGSLDSYSIEHTLGHEAAQKYMQTVDHCAEKVLGKMNPFHCYLISTWLVETRALSVYPVYEEALTALGFSGFLKGILQDEEKHAGFIELALKHEISISAQKSDLLLGYERHAFAEFCQSVFH